MFTYNLTTARRDMQRGALHLPPRVLQTIFSCARPGFLRNCSLFIILCSCSGVWSYYISVFWPLLPVYATVDLGYSEWVDTEKMHLIVTMVHTLSQDCSLSSFLFHIQQKALQITRKPISTMNIIINPNNSSSWPQTARARQFETRFRYISSQVNGLSGMVQIIRPWAMSFHFLCVVSLWITDSKSICLLEEWKQPKSEWFVVSLTAHLG